MDADALYRAVEVRDARFAGQFYLGVRTTGVYCRPGCPARMPKKTNVVFFPSAAAARTAGFRACMRCRPDAAPGSPAQAGTLATLSRAVRLLEETGDARGLPDRLGVSERHLRRLFVKHLGAAPQAVLRTRRLDLARQLIESSALPMIDVAHAAGFQSVRRFNDAVRSAFGRPPRALRKERLAPPATLELKLAFREPFDFEALLGFFAPRALPGIEQVEGGVWRRTVREGVLEVSRGPQALLVRMPASLSPRALQIAARVQHVFDLRADPARVREHLSKDRALRPYLREGLRIPGAFDPFEMAVRAILGQQISVERARQLATRLVEERGERLAHGWLFPTPEAVAGEEPRGMPGARARAIVALARAVAEKKVRLEGGDDLRALPGVGDWTAELIALRALGDPDAFPAADLGLCQSLGTTPRELLARAESWRPFRGYAAAAIWLGGSDAVRR